ncbi:MAG: FGGY-family carbohydrate kinase [Chloroflexi bacterium]|nr:FGGY-family carbohydrate kinase [Chloroflexota bacterium]
MDNYLIAYDLGTGGNKASLYDTKGNCISDTFVPYQTYYPKAGWHEQRPEDWWKALVESTRELIQKSSIDVREIAALGISGHSNGVVPLDKDGQLLRERTPIWSDARAVQQAKRMFEKINEGEWYYMTGNGFPAPLYAVFKMMWYQDNEPEMFSRIDKIIGTKDYINYQLTGRVITDHSYASGSGVYDLVKWQYSDMLIKASGISRSIFPEIVPSTEVIGTLNCRASEALGLPQGVKVVAGGVDNSCMALGARNIKEGRIYNSQGSSSWIAVTSKVPVLDDKFRPFVFSAVIPGLFNSAIPVFSSGSSFRWLRDNLCLDLVSQARAEGTEVYDLMTTLAATSPVGARGVLFNPNLGGGSSVDESINIRGAYLGLDLGHNRADMIRATMEGIAMEMRMALDELHKKMTIKEGILVVGGGSRSPLWRQIYADLYKLPIIKTNIDQQAAALGAAILAGIGAGFWNDFEIIDEIHHIVEIREPIPAHVEIYDKIMPVFKKSGKFLAEMGDTVMELGL